MSYARVGDTVFIAMNMKSGIFIGVYNSLDAAEHGVKSFLSTPSGQIYKDGIFIREEVVKNALRPDDI